ncbi:MAG TPA: hypothetical protein VL996_09810, partial [Methylocella sp.]|nr:hypothetical protein [Methylocella sp.]
MGRHRQATPAVNSVSLIPAKGFRRHCRTPQTKDERLLYQRLRRGAPGFHDCDPQDGASLNIKIETMKIKIAPA